LDLSTDFWANNSKAGRKSTQLGVFRKSIALPLGLKKIYICIYFYVYPTYKEVQSVKRKKQLTMKEWLNRPKKRISVWMDQWQIEQLKTLSLYTRVNASEYIREGIGSVLQKYRKNYRKAKKELKRDM
jgi:hypothetical protein